MQALKVIATAGSLWLVPIILLALTLESDSSFTQHAIFFSKTAVVAHIIQQAEQTYHWLQPGEILDGIGMTETTPGLLVYAVCWLRVRVLKS
jgi:chromate transporter